MKAKLFSVLVVVAMLAASGALAADAQPSPPGSAPGGLIPPPAIYIPYGGKIVTEINLSDNDMLGIIKQAIPAAAEALKTFIAVDVKSPVDGKPPLITRMSMVEMIAAIDARGLVEAIAGIRNIRIVIAKYAGPIDPVAFSRQFDAGAAKIGKLSKIASDFAFSPGVFGLYAEPDNAGYLAFAYDPQGRLLYAARIVGSVDVPKLIAWAGSIAKMFMAAHAPATVPEPPPAVQVTPEPPADDKKE